MGFWTEKKVYMCITHSSSSSSYSSIGTTAHCGLWPVEQCPSIFSYLPPTLSIFSLPALEDLFLLPLSIFSWFFPFFSSLHASAPYDTTGLVSVLYNIILVALDKKSTPEEIYGSIAGQNTSLYFFFHVIIITDERTPVYEIGYSFISYTIYGCPFH